MARKSDQRKLFFCLRKKQQDKQAWNGKREMASKKDESLELGDKILVLILPNIYCVGFCKLIYLQSIKI
ncbi:MAG: hypothetical protein CVU07_08980 [Bacteroidetes bacterium HGW-Bacteroidetes-23]|nr:MAG: hypothetical protein CVU07_08980 [Bacteroidetes bacterium HGW-Bacteroidetes-23]